MQQGWMLQGLVCPVPLYHLVGVCVGGGGGFVSFGRCVCGGVGVACRQLVLVGDGCGLYMLASHAILQCTCMHAQ
jgi:hypothetical protein